MYCLLYYFNDVQLTQINIHIREFYSLLECGIPCFRKQIPSFFRGNCYFHVQRKNTLQVEASIFPYFPRPPVPHENMGACLQKHVHFLLQDKNICMTTQLQFTFLDVLQKNFFSFPPPPPHLRYEVLCSSVERFKIFESLTVSTFRLQNFLP